MTSADSHVGRPWRQQNDPCTRWFQGFNSPAGPFHGLAEALPSLSGVPSRRRGQVDSTDRGSVPRSLRGGRTGSQTMTVSRRVAERDLLSPAHLAKRRVNPARSEDVNLYSADAGLRAVLAAPALVAGRDDLAMMGEPVEQGRGHLGIAEHRGLFADGETAAITGRAGQTATPIDQPHTTRVSSTRSRPSARTASWMRFAELR